MRSVVEYIKSVKEILFVGIIDQDLDKKIRDFAFEKNFNDKIEAMTKEFNLEVKK